ncbi:MAG: type VI secretion system protein TssA [Pirellulales bacterium]
MASDDVVDVALLGGPLAGGQPAGQDLRWDAVYDQIREARTESDRHILEGGEERTADWAKVIQLTTDVLASRSKDLMVAAWLTEALTMRHGFAGLRDGLRVMAELLERVWDDLYPLPDDGDLEPRVAPVAWLMDADRGARLPNRLRELPLIPDPDQRENFSWSYWKSRYTTPRGTDESDDVYAERQQESARREERFETGVQSTNVEQVMRLHGDLQGVREAFHELDRVATERFGDLAPGISGFRTALDEIATLVRRLARDKGGLVEGGAEADDRAAGGTEGSSDAQSAPASRGGATGPIQSRDDAFRRLAEVSEYLRRTEPQSPIPLLIDRAILWGRMPFHKLLREIVKDSTARDQVRDLLGIGGDDESAEG